MNQIIWRKWEDPLLPLVKGERPKPYEPHEDEDDPDYHAAVRTFRGEDDEDGGYAGRYAGDPGKGNAGPCVVGPMGVIPMFESNLPSKLFNFWMGDANFDITDDVMDAVEAVPGVEAVDVFSRYRFRVAVGRAFGEEAVLRAIDAVVQPPPAKPKVRKGEPDDRLAWMKRMLARAHRHWAIVVLPGGKHQNFGGGTVEEVRAKAEKYAGVAVRVITSWEGE